MSAPNIIPQSTEWMLLDALRRHVGRIATVDWETVNDSLRLKNHCQKIEFELRSFFNENLQSLADLEFEDDDNSAGAVQQAMHQLPEVCGLLESRLNSGLGLVGPEDTTYPNLTAIVEHLDSSTGSTRPFAFLSSSLPYRGWIDWLTGRKAKWEILFLFDGMTADKSSAAVEMLKNLNKLIEGLKRSIASLDGLSYARVPFSRSPYSKSQSTYSYFLRQAKAVFQTILSSHLQCSHREEGAHEILLQLPHLGDIDSCAASRTAPELEAFLSVCPERRWQEASFRLVPGNENITYRNLKLCPAIRSTEQHDIRLEVHVLHHVNVADYEGCDVQVLFSHNDRRLGSDPGMLLSDLIEAGLVGSPESGDTSSGIRIDRRSLAAKLVLGMLLSLQFDHIQAWDPEKIYILHRPKESHYVSCTAMRPDPRSGFQLPELDPSSQDISPPFLALTRLARTLLEICYGQLPRNELTGSADAHGNEWRALKKEIEDRTKNEEGSVRNLTFLAAARACLFFHYSYAYEYYRLLQRENRGDKHVSPVDLAKYTFYHNIMRKFEDNEQTNSQSSQDTMEEYCQNSKEQDEQIGTVPSHNGHYNSTNGDSYPAGFSESTELPVNIKKPPSGNGQSKSPDKIISLFDDIEERDGHSV
ncbi:hypothetical protein K469DRAFT_38321 [Zopfia rhizophila CBS 207.26]|uniref:DUF7580 domain-containing protein n=1 Tax=Zopfia rhizophila CBS 207.26 TaxID=1314779 RepID=A0A6A6DAE8_9PEZI|nr:hypothetical protein K469DRAFT_38321 [Zopfia rhizophila CBS 207.26]